MVHISPIWVWLGVIGCVTLSALFAGLNLAIFSLSQLRLQIEADGGNGKRRAFLIYAGIPIRF
jgi:metal transporter CNNM